MKQYGRCLCNCLSFLASQSMQAFFFYFFLFVWKCLLATMTNAIISKKVFFRFTVAFERRFSKYISVQPYKIATFTFFGYNRREAMSNLDFIPALTYVLFCLIGFLSLVLGELCFFSFMVSFFFFYPFDAADTYCSV